LNAIDKGSTSHYIDACVLIIHKPCPLERNQRMPLRQRDIYIFSGQTVTSIPHQ
jgi:hypothetical protein